MVDVYVLAPERSVAAVNRFLDRFLPNRTSSDEYLVPEHSDPPVAEFDNPDEWIAYCCAYPDLPSRAYWGNRTNGEPHSAHVFFLPAGGLVLGISIWDDPPTEWERWLTELRSFTGAEIGYYVGECPPADTIAEFVSTAREMAASWAEQGYGPPQTDTPRNTAT